jgi:hypothetical protein
VELESDFDGTNFGTLNLIESTIEDNYTCAVWGPWGKAVIDRSTISGNSGVSCGGVHVGSVEISNSTISGNTYNRDGIYGGKCEMGSGVDAAAVQISNSTIVGNGPTDDLSYGLSVILRFPRQPGEPPPDPRFICLTRAGEPVIVENSIIGSCANPAGVVAPSGGGNLESPGDTCLFTQPTDQVNVSTAQLNLDVLADNGGPTDTHDLLPGSFAIDAIPSTTVVCPSIDQRHAARPFDGDNDGMANCDSGAVEMPEPNHTATMLAGAVLLALLYRRRARDLRRASRC